MKRREKINSFVLFVVEAHESQSASVYWSLFRMNCVVFN